MVDGKPGFLNNIGDTEEEREIISVLEDGAEEQRPIEPQKPEGEQNNEPDKEEDTTGDKPEESGDKKTPDSGGEGDNQGDKDNPVEEPKKEDKPEELYLGRFKTKEEATKHLEQMEQAAARAKETPKEPDKLDEEIKHMLANPMIEAQLPNPDHYYIEGENGAKVFDLNSYMADYTRNLTLGIQKELLGGRLSAASFGMLQRALGEEAQKASLESQKEEEANTILTDLVKNFPVLKDDEKIQERFERAIYGEQARRQRSAQAEGKDPEGMVYKDYEDLLIEIVGDQPKPGEQQPDPTEKPKGGPALTGNTQPKDEIDEAIDGMMNVKKRSIF